MSVRLRLTLWYTALTAVTLIVSSVILYVVLQETMIFDADAFLTSKAKDLGASTQVIGGPSTFWVRLPDLDRFAESDVFVQVLDRNGDILDESLSMGSYGMPMDPLGVAPGLAGQVSARTVTVRGVRIRVDTVPLRLPTEQTAGPFHVLQVGQSFGRVEATVTWLRRTLLVGDAVLILLAAAVGWWMAGSSLRPIVRTTKSVQAIGESGRLDRRIEYSGPEDEIGDLIHTFNRMLDRLEASISAQRRFIADASHELRTPLTTLRLNVELLRRDRAAEPPERAEVLDDVGSELDRLSRLVQGMLDLARADAGTHLEKQPVRADELIRDVYHQVRPTANGVLLTVGDLVPITMHGNPDYVKQLLLTLVDNALKYTPSGGSVRLALERDDRWIKFIVADTGRGIAAEDMPHIFERFYRARSVRRERGTGLGLAVAQWIANEHGGHIEVQSEPGTGTVFTAWLPSS
jgi:two-component system OmpR family sensor kinase